MNIEEIKELVSLFNDSNLQEFHYQNQQESIQLSKRSSYPNNVVPAIEKAAVNVELPAEELPSSTPIKEVTPSEIHDAQYITSPIVGLVYLQASPDQPAYVQVGDSIPLGQTVCIIEAMKIMNEIKADSAGEIVEVLVENGQMVDYGQPLFAIKTK